ncbi:MAG: formylglycine-generating enzyme family protein [Verrucomicrobia bacterium]|nr:formylglycine-generating enzyme family protein [Verrucomicrobiota bacterium]
MRRTLLVALCLLGTWQSGARAQWLPVTNVLVDLTISEQGGPFVTIEYDLEVPDLSPASPAFVFVRFSPDDGKNWHALPAQFLRGDGHAIVESHGHKKLLWWGVDQFGIADAGQLKIVVRGVRMVRVPGGAFKMNLIPGGGFDTSKSEIDQATLPTFHIAKYETTVGMYADYLNETGKDGRGWDKFMANPERCGIERNDNDTYTVTPGREMYPVNYVSWYAAQAYLAWAGLRLPTEAEFQKTLRGGLFLDGDDARKKPNPQPGRKFPWGDEAPDAGGVWRCNCDFDRNGSGKLARVGSHGQFSSPYGACDLVGNIAEWTLDAYATSYHAGLDGYRMIRGGSYMDPAAGCDAIAGASQLPAVRSRIAGFRGLCEGPK